jgi:hypothetical protein
MKRRTAVRATGIAGIAAAAAYAVSDVLLLGRRADPEQPPALRGLEQVDKPLMPLLSMVRPGPDPPTRRRRPARGLRDTALPRRRMAHPPGPGSGRSRAPPTARPAAGRRTGLDLVRPRARSSISDGPTKTSKPSTAIPTRGNDYSPQPRHSNRPPSAPTSHSARQPQQRPRSCSTPSAAAIPPTHAGRRPSSRR